MTTNTFSVRREDIREIRPYDDGAATAPLRDGQARLRVGPIALTSNNVTYAKLGEGLGYFDFFPAEDDAEGRVPAWGFGDVVESNAEGLDVGARVYGFFPMSTHLIVQPEGINDSGFTDGAAHRAPRAPIYNRYTRCDADPGYVEAREAHIALLRPLFSTAFLLADHFAREAYFGAEQVVLASASSKTAYATAFELARKDDAPRVVGLTSPSRRAFVERLGCYGEVLGYDELDALPKGRTVFVDMAGNAEVRAAVHRRYGDALTRSVIVGATHWDAPSSDAALPGPAPAFFFAPSVAAERMKEWGPAGLQQRIGQEWAAFLEPVCDPDDPWLRVVRHEGIDEAVATFRRFLEGGVAPDEGHVLTL